MAISCTRSEPRTAENITINKTTPLEASPELLQEKEKLRLVLEKAEIPNALSQKIMNDYQNEFMPMLFAALEGDPYLRLLVDKKHPIFPLEYTPDDLVKLTGNGAFHISRANMMLRDPAKTALEEMAQLAQNEGITLTVSSAYRSYDYQTEVYNRNVRQNGQATADRESARPGYSQHQLGMVIDFGSITDDFAGTPAGKWLTGHAAEFGWSLSFPQGYESITGYRWECWHYRYVGKPIVRFASKWFDGIQQYALQFLHEWECLKD